MTPENDITELIKNGNNEQLKTLLQDNASLAEGKTAQGVSYLLFALYCRNKTAVELIKQHKSSLDIYEAASLGDAGTVKRLADEQPALVNSFSPDGFTPLGLSCFFGHYPAAQLLIEKGAGVNTPSNNSFMVMPLHSACAISNYELAELLLKNGADVNAKQMAGVTALHEAAHNRQAKLAQLLIDHGADVNAKMDNGQTPFFMAEDEDSTETADLIRSYGGR